MQWNSFAMDSATTQGAGQLKPNGTTKGVRRRHPANEVIAAKPVRRECGRRGVGAGGPLGWVTKNVPSERLLVQAAVAL